MPATRHDVAAAIADKFLPAKQHSVLAAASSLECVATMLIERGRARMPDPNFGADILAQAMKAASTAFEAQAEMHEVHALLAPIRREWAIPPMAFGPNDTANPMAERELRAVA